MYAWYTLTGSSDACASTLTALRAAAASVASLKDTIMLHEIQYIGIGKVVRCVNELGVSQAGSVKMPRDN